MSEDQTHGIDKIALAMFSVADQDAAVEFYTGTLGFKVMSDSRFGPNDESRWVEVAPPGSDARLALNPPMDGQPGGSVIGVESSDVEGEHARLSEIDGLDVGELMSMPGAPRMFRVGDPDGNSLFVVEPRPAA